ncbi:putative transcription factor TGA like domain-containing protein [Dioscorea sansibarensis]
MASSSSTTTTTTNQDPARARFEEWLARQEADLQELIHATTSPHRDDAELRALVSKALHHFGEYIQKRRAVAKDEATELFCPPWCSSFEKSSFWLGGCRPSMAIRLLYCVAGAEIQAHLNQVLAGASTPITGMAALSPLQLHMVNELQVKIIQAEDKLSSKMASLQEDMVDKPLFQLVRERGVGSGGGGGGVGIQNGNVDVEKAMSKHVEEMGEIVEEADRMRLATLNELVMGILTAAQAAEFLVAVEQLHLTIHQWGGLRDLQRAYRRGG